MITLSAGAPPQGQVLDGVFLDGIACASDGTCYAVGGDTTTGVVVPIDDGQAGQAQEAPGTVLLSDIDCVSGDICYAVGQSSAGAEGSGTSLVPIVAGQPEAATPLSGGYFRTIACPSPAGCYAFGWEGTAASANEGQGTGAVIGIVGGQPGTTQTVPAAGPLGAVACQTSNTCLAISEVHNPLGPGQTQQAGFPPRPRAIVPIVLGLPGAVTPIDPGSFVSPFDPLIGIACPSATNCYAITKDQIIPLTVGGG